MVENFIGEVQIGKITEYKYLGFIISAKGDNMANINAIKKKSIGIIRTLIQKLEDMKLKNYENLFKNLRFRIKFLLWPRISSPVGHFSASFLISRDEMCRFGNGAIGRALIS